MPVAGPVLVERKVGAVQWFSERGPIRGRLGVYWRAFGRQTEGYRAPIGILNFRSCNLLGISVL